MKIFFASKILLFLAFLFAIVFNTANLFGQGWLDPLPPLDPVPEIDGGTDNVPLLPPPPSLPMNFINRPELPVFPSTPGSNTGQGSTNQNTGPMREILRYELTVTGAFPNGDMTRNTASSITGAWYILYSDSSIALNLVFAEGLLYIYHFTNPGSRMEINPGVFRQSYNTIIQAGVQFLPGEYRSELYHNGENLVSANIMGNNSVIVLLNMERK